MCGAGENVGVPSGDATYYAHWERRSRTVTWDANGGSVSPGSSTVDSGSTTTAPTPSRTGYSFDGWYTAASGGSHVCGAAGSVTVTANVTYYAHWSPVTYNVRYFDKAGNHKATDVKSYDTTFSLRGNPGWTAAGYTAQGWARSANQASASHSFGQGSMRNLASTQGANVDFYVAETANAYNVRYFAKDGTHIATDQKAYGTTFSLRANPSKTAAGYTAQGWARSKNQTAKAYSFGQSVSNLATSGNFDLYVAETANAYAVTLDRNGGTGGSGSVTATYGSAMPSMTKPTRTGYTFAGYWDARSGGTQYYTAAGASARTWNKASNATLYARWTANTYTVGFNANGGSGGQSANVTATYDANMPAISTTKPTRTGYAFGGWYDAASGGTQYYTAAGASARTWNKASNATLYARWTANTYNVRYFDKAGNHLGTDQKAYDAYFNLRGNPNKTHPAYTAKGWARSANQTSASHAFGLYTRNLASAQGANFDLYVAETANEYGISYDTRGGSLSGQRTSYTFETPDFQLAEPTRVGYTFTGWEVSGQQGSGVASDGVHRTVRQGTWGNLSCVATWRANEYEVALAPDFPAFAMGSAYAGYASHGVTKDAGTASVTATYDSAMPAATMPRATGYAFLGYFDEAGTKYYEPDGSSVRTWDKPSAATLHGRWSLDRYEVTLDVGNGEVPSAPGKGWSRDPGGSGLYRLTYSIEWVQESGGSPRVQLPVPATKPGYASFDGWVGGGISKPSLAVQVQPWELADRAYTGSFSGLIGYTAALDLAGGRFDGAPEGWAEQDGSWAHGFTVESEAFPLPTPVRDGYSFRGWVAVAADGSLGSPEASVTVPKGSWGDRSWVASWQAIEYRIDYDLAGGSMSGQRESYDIETPGFELPAPTRDGYAFQGWEVAGAHGAGVSQAGVVTTVKQGTWGDLQATAKWTTVDYTASLDLADGRFEQPPAGWSESGGSWTRGFTVESDGFNLPTPSRAGHDFRGWALVAPDGSLGEPATGVTVPKGTWGDRSYRAVWEARTYTVTWHYAGQTIDGKGSDSSAQAYGQPISFPARPSAADPAREHYEFAGWFTEQSGGEQVAPGDYLLESDSTWYARWSPVEYVVHLHLGDDDAYSEHAAFIEKDGAALPMAPDGHFDVPYTVEDEVALPRVTDDPGAMKPVREGMEFMGWVECSADGSYDPSLVPQLEVTLPVGSHGERHFRAAWAFALRFEVPSAVSFRFDLADDPAFADAPYGPVQAVSGEGIELRSHSLGQLAVADVAVDVDGIDPDAVVSDRSKVKLRVRDASLDEPWVGWVPLPTTSAPEGIDPFDLADLGFGEGSPVAPLAAKPLLYQVEVQDPTTTLAGEVDGLPLAKIVFTVRGLW